MWEVGFNYDLEETQSNSQVKGIEIYIYMQLENEISSTDAIWDKYFAWGLFIWRGESSLVANGAPDVCKIMAANEFIAFKIYLLLEVELINPCWPNG